MDERKSCMNCVHFKFSFFSFLYVFVLFLCLYFFSLIYLFAKVASTIPTSIAFNRNKTHFFSLLSCLCFPSFFSVFVIAIELHTRVAMYIQTSIRNQLHFLFIFIFDFVYYHYLFVLLIFHHLYRFMLRCEKFMC